MGANASTAVPVYASGQVLDAARLNLTNAGIPVFGGTALRDAAFGGSGEKVLAEGQFCFLEDSDTTQFYDGASWKAVNGSRIGQVVSTSKTDTFSSATTGAFTDITGISVSITPTLATSKVFVMVSIVATGPDSATTSKYVRLVRDSTAIFIGDTAGSRISASTTSQTDLNYPAPMGFNFLDSPATTSATTYKMQFYQDLGTFYLNRSNNDPNGVNAGRFASSITVMEVIV